MSGLLSKERIIAKPGFNRWLVPPASVAIHLCIGSVYAWSIFNPPLMKVYGVAASSADDWTLKQVAGTFTVAIVFLGLSAAFAGKWLEKVGPRKVGTAAAFCWGGGFLLGSLGISSHQLWLLYLGYGVVGGCGLGLAYVSPVSTLIKWFPDRRGMAAGMAIMGFGGGAMIAAPMKEALIEHFYQPAVYVGTSQEVQVSTDDNSIQYTERDGKRIEVVVVSENEKKMMVVPGEAGVYEVGTGKVGVANTFLVLGVVYFIVMIIAAFSYRLPAEGWMPGGWIPPTVEEAAKEMISTHTVTVDQAMKTPQFYYLWIVLCLNVTAGIGVLGVAKTMMSEIFGSQLPEIVDGTFAATYVLMTSVFNMLGRFFWASTSDYLGRQKTYTIFFVLGILLYLSIPLAAHQVSASPVVVWLVCFYAATMIIFTMYGGGFATIPAYIADLFGSRFVGGIHGRLLTAWSTAGVLGPLAITSLRELSVKRAIEKLVAQVDPAVFQQEFNAPVEQLKSLVEKKTVTISRLMELVPAGTVDPSSMLYNTTMYLMAALLGVALVSNLLVRPVSPKHYLAEDEQ
jgi:MFS family permease